MDKLYYKNSLFGGLRVFKYSVKYDANCLYVEKKKHAEVAYAENDCTILDNVL